MGADGLADWHRALAPLLDPNDIEKRIADLKSVETWLSMNMNVLRMTIQGLEMQKATLAAFQLMQPKAARSRSRSSERGAGIAAALGGRRLVEPAAADAEPAAGAEARREPEKKGK